MKVEIEVKTQKYLENLNEPHKSRIKKALAKLEKDPPEGDITALIGKDGFRLRVGGYRVLFEIDDNVIYIYQIGLRGQIYKRK